MLIAAGAVPVFVSFTHGQGGITDYAEAYGGKGKITNDTQMTLFTAEGLQRKGMRTTTCDAGGPGRIVLVHFYRRVKNICRV